MDAAIAIEMHMEIAETVNDSKDFDVRAYFGCVESGDSPQIVNAGV